MLDDSLKRSHTHLMINDVVFDDDDDDDDQ